APPPPQPQGAPSHPLAPSPSPYGPPPSPTAPAQAHAANRRRVVGAAQRPASGPGHGPCPPLPRDARRVALSVVRRQLRDGPGGRSAPARYPRGAGRPRPTQRDPRARVL